MLLFPAWGFAVQPPYVSGHVYIDSDGSTGANKVDGVGLGSIGSHQLYAVLVGGGISYGSTPIASDGSYYSLLPSPNLISSVWISTTNYPSGTTPIASLPSGWAFNGEINNDAANSLTGNTLPTDGKVINIPTGYTYETNVNFGIHQIPSISLISSTICDGNYFSITPVDGINGVVPTGTTYSWPAPTGTGFTGGSSSSGSSADISGTLFNSTNGPHLAAYTVTPTSGGINGSPFTVNVTVYPLPIFLICPANITLQNKCNPVVTYVATTQAMQGVVTTLSYEFTGATTGSGSGTGTGSIFNYGVTHVSITATNNCGTTTCNFTITIIDTINPTITCPPDINTITITGCTATGVILGTPVADDNCGVASIVNNAPVEFPLGVTIVTWTATDISGNTATCNQTVTVTDVNGTCHLITPGGPDNVCQSSTPSAITLSGASVGGSATTGAWSITSPSGSGTLSSTDQTTDPSTVTYTPAVDYTGTVTLTLTSNGSPIATGTRTINVNPLPSVAAITGPTAVCVGSTISLADATNFGSWSSASPGVATVSAGGAGGLGGVVTGLLAGTSEITYTVYNGSCSNSVTQLVTVTGIPTVFGVHSGSVCGTGTATLGAAPSSGIINWYDASTGGNLVGTGNIFTTPVLSSSMTYYVEATNNGCTSASRTAVVATVNPLPAVPVISGIPTVCAGNNIQLTGSPSGGSWISASPLIATVTLGKYDFGGLVTGLLAGTSEITYTVTNENGCSNSVTQLVTVTDIPTVTETTPGSVCGTGTVTLGATASSGTINWYAASTGGLSLGTGNSFTTPGISTTTMYYVDATSECGTTASRTAVIATVNALPIVSASANVAVGSTITLSPTSGGTWVSSNDAIATVTNEGLVTGVSVGTVTFMFTDAITGCSVTTSSVIVGSVCLDFENGANTANWKSYDVASVLIGQDPNDSGNTSHVLRLTDGPGGSIAFNNIDFGGNWLERTQEGCLCFDYKVKWTGSSDPHYFPLLGIYAGPTLPNANYYNSNTLRATFYANPGTDPIINNIWQHWCLPLELSSNSALPSNGNGYWIVVENGQLLSGTYACQQWDYLITHVTGLVLNTDYNSSPSEVVSFDNFCWICSEAASIRGMKFNDLDGNGLKNGSETGLSGWEIKLTYFDSLNNLVTLTRTTDATGNYCFNNLPAGTYTINETQKPYWTQTFPSNTGSYSVTLVTGEQVVGKDFGNHSTPEITGTTPGSVCETGTVTLGATASLGIINWYAVYTGGLSLGTGNLFTTPVISATTSYWVDATSGSGTSVSRTEVVATVNPLPEVPLISGALTVCAGFTTTLTGSPSGGSWISASPLVATVTPNSGLGGPGGIVTSLLAGTSEITYTVTNENGCENSAKYTITVNPTPAAPIVGTITQPTCEVPTGSVALSGLPAGSWTLNPGGITGSTTSTTLTGLAPATYNFIVTNAAGCISLASFDAVINPLPATPAAPIVGTITQPTCSVATGSVALSGLPAGSWTLNPGDITGSTTSTTLTGLVPATYNFIVTNAAGCSSLASFDVVINPLPATPAAPIVETITQPTCEVPTGSVALSGLPAGSWTLNPGGITGSTTSTTLTGLAPATYNFIVTNAAGCSSLASFDVVINPLPATPAAPIVGTITQPTCEVATGSVALSGLPAVSWTLNPGGITGSTTSTTLTGLAPATYNFIVTNEAGCSSLASLDAVINPLPATPAAPIVGTITQPTCEVATGSVALSGLPAGSWTLNPGDITGSTTSTTLTGLAPDSYNFIVTNASGCISLASVNVILQTNCDSIDLKVTETLNNSSPDVGQQVVFTITGTNDGPANATGTTITSIIQNGYTFVSATTTTGTYDPVTGLWSIGNLNNGASETLAITVTVNPTGNYVMTSIIGCNEVEETMVNNVADAELIPVEFLIPEGFSPNGDDYNDRFEIIHATILRLEIEVFNRWGNSVYKNKDYKNDWDGKGTGNFLGKDLPDGTYYCTYKAINISTGENSINGVKYITLRR